MATPAAARPGGCRQILEDLIGLGTPDRARELSDRLLERFGSFPEALNATEGERIKAVGGDDLEGLFSSVRTAIHHVLRDRLLRGAVLADERAVLDYLRGVMAFAPQEQFRVLYLNAGNELLCDEVASIGSVSTVHIYPREVLKRCLELGATAIIVAHNHPSGRLVASRSDRVMTRNLVEAAKALGVAVHDHILVAREGSLSFRRKGFL
ncbi:MULTISPECIES: JAB domain-containing protein [Sphingomonadaceae]|uniref:JAB domain-containing protein n=1 Tax=Sphingomonadales TaxID=204457 RepID=UPI0018D4F938|nr:MULTISPECIES: DNA repair protein RadC [Sphingomonadaceae]